MIAVAEGGFLETMDDGETGKLLKPDFSDKDLAEAVMQMTKERASSMRDACIKQAQKFSLMRLEGELKSYIGG